MPISNDGPEVFSSYASRKSCSEITAWIPWPLIRDLGGGANYKWPSNHFRLYTMCCLCTEAQEMRAPCMFDWQGTQTFFSGWNAKSQIWDMGFPQPRHMSGLCGQAGQPSLPHNFKGNKSMKILIHTNVAILGNWQDYNLLILIKLLNDEIAQISELLDWTIATFTCTVVVRKL